MELSDLTPGEKLKLNRRRLGCRHGQSQKKAAKRWRVTLYRYRQAETDRLEDYAGLMPRLIELREYEACYILRLRKNLSVIKMAKKIKVSEWWLIKMEHGREDSAKLVNHWAA